MAIEELSVNGLLVEGFDESKLKKESFYDEDWRTVIAARQNDKILHREVIGIDKIKGKYCAIVAVGHIRGFIPMDFMDVENVRHLRSFAGKPVVFKVLEYIDEEDNRTFIASRKAARDDMAEVTLRKLEEGELTVVVVQSVSPRLAIADIGGISVTIDKKNLKYGWVDDLTDHLKVGDHLRVKVLSIDKENKRVEVSAKAAQENPWSNVMRRYKKGVEYIGTVSGVQDYGVFVNLEDGVDALASHLKFEALAKGDKVLVRLTALDEKEEQIRARIIRKCN